MTGKEIFEALAAPFPADQVRSRPGKFGKDLAYITARTARLRLNEALGPENWSCVITPAERWVKCSLTIVIDGRSITREALGGYPDMPSEEDRVKGGDSDSFKRACSLFGIGEYLYGDDSHHHERGTEYPPRADHARQPDTLYRPTKEQVSGWYDRGRSPSGPDNEPTRRRIELGWPRDGASFYAWIMKVKDQYEWPSILEEIKETFVNALAYKYPFKFKEWDSHMVETGAQWVAAQCAATDRYKGEFNDHLGVAKS